MRRLVWLAAMFASAASAEIRFHHVTANVTDPSAAIDFYAKRFDCEREKFNGKEEAVWAQKSWIFLNKVKHDPPHEIYSAIWHIGWGAEDMKREYQRQLDLGTKFETPLTDISKLANFNGFYYAYVDGPSHSLIELNTAGHHRFGHLHLLSDDPIAAAEWYASKLGIGMPPRRAASGEKRYYEGFQVGPSASFFVNNVNVIIFPSGYIEKQWPKFWEVRKGFASTKGRAIDHIGFSVHDLDDTIASLRNKGVTILGRPGKFRGSSRRAIFTEGPDRILIQIVEGHAEKKK
jgi:catechol 2,3-dioxygenase-like lactoylglutathione lyase family enzyme